MNHKPRVENHGRNVLLCEAVEQCLNGLFGLEVNVLHARGIEIAVHQHLISCGVAVKAAEDDMLRRANLVILVGRFERRDNRREKKI